MKTKSKSLLSVVVILFVSFFLSGCGLNKVVNIKYGDSINISQWEALDTSKSSFVEGAWYDKNSSQTVIKLNGSYYKYCNFPTNIWKNFKSSESFGNYYNSNIKGNYICSEKTTIKNDDYVFDHTIPLSLGGGDFSSTSIDNFKKEIENLPGYNESYLTCMYDAVKEESKILTEAKYKRESDGSWIDNDGNYPSPNLEMKIEVTVTESFKSCIN